MRQWLAGATVGMLVLVLTGMVVGQTGGSFGDLPALVKGNNYRENIGEVGRLSYLAGVIDAWVLQAYAKNDLHLETAETFSRCRRRLGPGFTLIQAEAIVERYLQANPDKWNWPMSMLISLAFDDACR
jgi:hypothetical protein